MNPSLEGFYVNENGRFKYVYLDNFSGELYYFEYHNEGKISKSYQQAYISFEGATFNARSFDLTVFNNDNNTHSKYFGWVFVMCF
ncbi:hypothetical protein [Tamlana flava]|uniref:hypothetical protein n=1 Tax=Tamlana flava TaxID=3158572 RepID=UPI00351B31C8